MKVKFGAWVKNLDELKKAMTEQIGNSYGVVLPKTFAAALELAEYCRDHKITFIFREIVSRNDYDLPEEELFAGKLSAAEIGQVIDVAGESYLGRVVLGESGGMLYWPLEYLREPYKSQGDLYLGGPYSLLSKAETLAQAKDIYSSRLATYLAKEKQRGGEPFWDVDASMVFRNHLEVGIKIPYLEMMAGNPERMIAALRGAARCHGSQEFGALIAHTFYGGGQWDELFLKRWKNTLYISYLSGLTTIHSECGHFGFEFYGNHIQEYDPLCVEYRNIMREFFTFSQNDQRHEDGPLVTVGIVYGNLDGYPGLWTNSVWGQYENPPFACTDAEKSWDLLNTLHQKRPWYDNLNIGDRDYSGQPALGTYDIVPAEATLETMQKYSCLIFLGWNTMNRELYEKLLAYVKNSGRIFASLPHLCDNIRRDESWHLFNNGDFQELFGVSIEGSESHAVTGIKFVGSSQLSSYSFPDWSGDCDPKFMGKGFYPGRLKENHARTLAHSSKYFCTHNSQEKTIPILLENSCGKGCAFLLNAWEFPGNENLFVFWRTLLLCIMKAEQPKNLKMICSDKIRYAVYRDSVYIFNTDYDLPSICKIGDENQTREVILSPQQIIKLKLPLSETSDV